MRGFLQSNNLPFLVKPFEVADLIAATRNLLQKTQAAAVAAGN
jgi:DNA-binding response OmpR family regulator